MKMIDLTGNTYGRLKALDHVGRDKKGNVQWLCLCDCGNETTVSSESLRRGKSQSCGCLRREVDREGIRRYKAGLETRSDRVGRFVDERIREVIGHETASKSVYAAYVRWANDESETPLSNQSFRQAFDRFAPIERISTRTIKGKPKSTYVGVLLHRDH